MNSDDKAAIERAEKLAEHLLSRYAAYHDRKEAMAHAIFLLEVALFGAVITAKNWPPTWISNEPILFRGFALLLLTLLCLLAHILIRWQLRKRRWAALRYAGILQVVSKWVSSPPTPEDLEPSQEKITGPRWWMKILDSVIPLPSARVSADMDNCKYPKAIADGLREQNEKCTGAVFAESILSYVSIFMLLVVLIRSFPLISCWRLLFSCGCFF